MMERGNYSGTIPQQPVVQHEPIVHGTSLVEQVLVLVSQNATGQDFEIAWVVAPPPF